MELVQFETMDQFSPSFFEIREFSFFTQILLGLFDVSYTFQDLLELFILFEIFCLMLSQILL